MRFVISIVALIAFGCVCHADCWKITSRGHQNVWAVNSSCQANLDTCSTGQCATKPAPQPMPEAPQQTGTVTYGSCANGSCSTVQSSGFFRRRR